MHDERPGPEIRLVEPRRRFEIRQKPNNGNPMADLLREELGIDAFALDGDDRVLVGSWQDQRRK